MLDLPRYPFTPYAINGAPEDAGVVMLWLGEELIYIGATGSKGGIQELLRRQRDDGTPLARQATHYCWEIRRDAKARELELLQILTREHKRAPRCNAAAA